MMPMLRTLASASAAATAIPTLLRRRLVDRYDFLPRPGGHRAGSRVLPAVMREGLVGLRHLVGVLASLDRGAEAVARVQQLVLQTLDHGLLAAGLGVLDQPAKPEGGLARGADLDRHLVGRATDTAAADLEGRLDVVHRALQGHHRVGAALLLAALEGAVDDALGKLTLAADQDLVDQLSHQRGVVHRVRYHRVARSGALTRHVSSSPSSRRNGCGPACGCGHPGCPANRGRSCSGRRGGPSHDRHAPARSSAPAGCGRRPGCTRSPRSGCSASPERPCAAQSWASWGWWCTRACTRRAAEDFPSAPASWSCSSSPGGPCGPAAGSWAPGFSAPFGRFLRRPHVLFCLCAPGSLERSSGTRGRACRPAHGPAACSHTHRVLSVCVRPQAYRLRARRGAAPPLVTDSGARTSCPGKPGHEGKEYPSLARWSKRGSPTN